MDIKIFFPRLVVEFHIFPMNSWRISGFPPMIYCWNSQAFFSCDRWMSFTLFSHGQLEDFMSFSCNWLANFSIFLSYDRLTNFAMFPRDQMMKFMINLPRSMDVIRDFFSLLQLQKEMKSKSMSKYFHADPSLDMW